MNKLIALVVTVFLSSCASTSDTSKNNNQKKSYAENHLKSEYRFVGVVPFSSEDLYYIDFDKEVYKSVDSSSATQAIYIQPEKKVIGVAFKGINTRHGSSKLHKCVRGGMNNEERPLYHLCDSNFLDTDGDATANANAKLGLGVIFTASVIDMVRVKPDEVYFATKKLNLTQQTDFITRTVELENKKLAEQKAKKERIATLKIEREQQRFKQIRAEKEKAEAMAIARVQNAKDIFNENNVGSKVCKNGKLKFQARRNLSIDFTNGQPSGPIQWYQNDGQLLAFVEGFSKDGSKLKLRMAGFSFADAPVNVLNNPAMGSLTSQPGVLAWDKNEDWFLCDS